MERLTEWKDDKKLLAKAKFSGDFGSQNILQSLAEYEDLEELIGIPLKNFAEICNNKIPEECKNPKKAIVLTDKDVDRWNGYRDLEDRLHGISIKQVVDGFIKTVENQTHEGYENGRILTNEDAEEWKRYKENKAKDKILEMPCRVGDLVYILHKNIVEEEQVYDVQYRGITYPKGQRWFMNIGAEVYFEKDFGKTVFLTQEEAEQKLKEMESD